MSSDLPVPNDDECMPWVIESCNSAVVWQRVLIEGARDRRAPGDLPPVVVFMADLLHEWTEGPKPEREST